MPAVTKLSTIFFRGRDVLLNPPPRFLFIQFSLLWKTLACFLLFIATRPSLAVQTLTFNGITSTVSTGSTTLSGPAGVVVDSALNVYIADTGNNQILKAPQNGTASVLAITGLTSPSTLNAPKGLAIDGSGNLLIADSGNSRIVRVDASGTASVLSTGSVSLSLAEGITVNATGDIFIADTGNNQIVRVPTSGTPSVYSITGLTSPSTLNSPKGLAIDSAGNLYIADSGNGRVVEVTPGGAGTTLAITGVTPTTPASIAIDSYGTLYVVDSNSGSKKVIAVTTALVGTNFSSAHTLVNNQPKSVAVDIYGNVYAADAGSNRVEQVQTASVGFGHLSLGTSTSMQFSLVIGSTAGPNLTNLTVPTFGRTGLDFSTGGSTSCSAGTANGPTCIIGVSYNPSNPGYRQGAMILTYIDNSGSPSVTRSLTVPLYSFNDAPQAALYSGLASVVSSGAVATQTPYQIAVDGSGTIYAGNVTGNNVVRIPSTGSASVLSTGSFTLGHINGVAVDGAGNRYIADNQNNLIYQISPTNTTYQLSINIGGSPTTLSAPTALAVDGAGNLFIADNGNNRILKVALKDPTLTTTFPLTGIVVNTGSYTFTGNTITGIAVDSAQNLYVIDSTSSKLVKITPAGASTIVSLPGFTLSNPEGVAIDGMGNIYITDTGNNRVLQLTTSGVVSEIQIQGLTNPSTLGGGAGSHLYGLTTDASGNIYIADSSNNRIIKVTVTQASFTFASTKKNSTSTDSPKTATITNIGNQTLNITSNPTYTSNFTQNGNDPTPCTSTTSLTNGASCNISVKFTPQSIGTLTASINVSSNSLNTSTPPQVVAVSGIGLTAEDATAIAVSATPSPATIGQAVSITATVSDVEPGHTTTVPTGSVTFSDLVGTTVTTLNNGAPITLNNGVATLSGIILSGAGTHTLTATYAEVNGSFAASNNTTTITINKAPVVIAGPATQPVSIVNGQTGAIPIAVTGPYTTISSPSGTISYSITNSTGSSVGSGTTALSTGSTSSTATIPTSSALPPGNYTISVTYGGDANYLASSTATTVTLQVGKIAPTISLISSANPVLVTNPVTFTATLAATGGTPTGSVAFYDGATLLGSAALSSGKAVFITSSLIAATHSITASYSGDNTFSSVASSAVSELVQDYSLSVVTSGSSSGSGSVSQTTLPGGTATYALTLGASNGTTLPADVTLTVSGVPPGATATITPQVLPKGSSLTNVTLTVQLPKTTVALLSHGPATLKWSPVLLGLLLLPFGAKLRHSGRGFSRLVCTLLLTITSMGLAAGLLGCGASSSGYFGEQQKSYVITITATSGSISRSTTVNLTVQ